MIRYSYGCFLIMIVSVYAQEKHVTFALKTALSDKEQVCRLYIPNWVLECGKIELDNVSKGYYQKLFSLPKESVSSTNSQRGNWQTEALHNDATLSRILF